MELDQNTINYIIQFLKLNKLLVRQEISLLCHPSKEDEEFEEKCEIIKKQLGHNVTLKIVREGEICDDKPRQIEIPSESTSNGINRIGE